MWLPAATLHESEARHTGGRRRAMTPTILSSARVLLPEPLHPYGGHVGHRDWLLTEHDADEIRHLRLMLVRRTAVPRGEAWPTGLGCNASSRAVIRPG